MNYSQAFLYSLDKVLHDGQEVSPRGQLTKEILSHTISVNALESLYVSPIRKLNFCFLFAENMWYMSGRNALSLLTPYNKNYASFANDGILQGSYGPMILEQIRYVVDALKEDGDSRQAVISLWRPNPRTAKDKPCTLTFHFMIRDGKIS